jgi:hypothetical protein
MMSNLNSKTCSDAHRQFLGQLVPLHKPNRTGEELQSKNLRAKVKSIGCKILTRKSHWRWVPFRCRVLITIAKLSAAKPIIATRPLPTGGNRNGALAIAAGRGFRSGPKAPRVNPAGALLDHVAVTGIVTALAGCGIKNVVTTRATSVIIQLCRLNLSAGSRDCC